MMKRTSWPMRVDDGTTRVGTARVRDDLRAKMTAAQKAIFGATGNRPQVDAGFDEIADGLDSGRPVSLSAQKSLKPPKYRNQRCEHEGIAFDSRRERDRWIHLCRERDARAISELERQVVFVLADLGFREWAAGDRHRRDDGHYQRGNEGAHGDAASRMHRRHRR